MARTVIIAVAVVLIMGDLVTLEEEEVAATVTEVVKGDMVRGVEEDPGPGRTSVNIASLNGLSVLGQGGSIIMMMIVVLKGGTDKRVEGVGA